MLIALVQTAIGTVLVVAGLGKLNNFERLARIVAGYEFVGWRLSRVVAAVLPWGEITVGAALVLALAAPLPALLATGMFAVFTVALAVNRWRGRTELVCGCFAEERPRPLTWLTIARPAALGLATAVTAMAPTAPIGRLGGLALAAAFLAAGAALRAISSDGGTPSPGYATAARLTGESRSWN